MVANFAEMLQEAGLQDSYTAHLGFQQLPARANSVNWVGQTSDVLETTACVGQLEQKQF